MASTSEISALSVRLLLLALLSLTTGAGADTVTWRECEQYNCRGRVVESLPDYNADELNIADCHITKIRRGDFDGLPNIESIYFTYNDIAHVDPAAFRSVQKLKELSLCGNGLRELPVFDEPSLFPNLTTLSLYVNRLTVIQHARTFSACTQLRHLFLNDNHIEYIHQNIFKPLTELTHLHLYNNKIAYIPKTMFTNNNKLTSLRLNKNRLSFLPLNFVTELSNAGARLSEFFFYDNPWHCACLLELVADVKRVGNTTYQGADTLYGHYPRYDGTRPVCVYSGAYPCSRHAPSGLLRAPPHTPASSSNSPWVVLKMFAPPPVNRFVLEPFFTTPHFNN